MDVSSALARLDKHAFEFNFPVLDNAYVELACARMSVFCEPSDWIITFEVLGYTINNGAFENYLYAYGSCLPKEGLLFADSVLTEVPESPLVDPPTQAWIANWSDWSAVVRKQQFHFTPSRTDYLKHNIVLQDEDGPGSLPESAVLRYFVASEGPQALFMTLDELSDALPRCPKMRLLVQTCEWEHPDVAGGGVPSESASICSALAAVQMCSAELFTSGIVNTRWEDWRDQHI
jgi:hypothetical protein